MNSHKSSVEQYVNLKQQHLDLNNLQNLSNDLISDIADSRSVSQARGLTQSTFKPASLTPNYLSEGRPMSTDLHIKQIDSETIP